MRYGVITWKSHRYPDKHYQAFCLKYWDYTLILSMVLQIRDYHSVVDHSHFV